MHFPGQFSSPPPPLASNNIGPPSRRPPVPGGTELETLKTNYHFDKFPPIFESEPNRESTRYHLRYMPERRKMENVLCRRDSFEHYLTGTTSRTNYFWVGNETDMEGRGGQVTARYAFLQNIRGTKRKMIWSKSMDRTTSERISAEIGISTWETAMGQTALFQCTHKEKGNTATTVMLCKHMNQRTTKTYMPILSYRYEKLLHTPPKLAHTEYVGAARSETPEVEIENFIIWQTKPRSNIDGQASNMLKGNELLETEQANAMRGAGIHLSNGELTTSFDWSMRQYELCMEPTEGSHENWYGGYNLVMDEPCSFEAPQLQFNVMTCRILEPEQVRERRVRTY